MNKKYRKTSVSKVSNFDLVMGNYKMFRRYRAYALYHKKRRIRKKYAKKLQNMYKVEDGIYYTMIPNEKDIRSLFLGGGLIYGSPTLGYLSDGYNGRFLPYSDAGHWYMRAGGLGMKCKVNSAARLIRDQGEQILRGEEEKNVRQHGKKCGRISGSYSRSGMEKYPKRRETAGDGENGRDQ